MGSLNCPSSDIISQSRIIFFDFDGVIKESVEIKNNAFGSIFKEFESSILCNIIEHAKTNIGITRRDKIKLYLDWLSISTEDKNIDYFIQKYSEAVYKDVINSQWVPGVIQFINTNFKDKMLFLVSATPHDELLRIIKDLKLDSFFKEVFGAPSSKVDSLNIVLRKYNFAAQQALFFGDSEIDLAASQNIKIPFVLRVHDLNEMVASKFSGYKIFDFKEL